MIPRERVRPVVSGALSLAGRTRSLLERGFREAVLDDLRGGVVDLRGLPRVTRALVLAGFGLLFAMIGALFVGGFVRFGPLVALSGAVSDRGLVAPVALLPVTLFALAVAWSFMLAGALHARRTVRVLVVGVYLFFAVLWTGQISDAFASGLQTLLAWGLLLAVPVFFAARWRKRPRFGFEFFTLFALVVATFALAQRQGVEAWRVTGFNTVFQSLDITVETVGFLTFPLFFLIGLDIADFVYRTSDWTSRAAAHGLPLTALLGALGLLALFRLYGVLAEAFSRAGSSSWAEVLLSYLGALGIPLLVGAVWYLVFGRAAPPAADGMSVVARRAGPLVVLLYFGTSVVVFLLFLLSAAVGLAFGSAGLLERLWTVDVESATRFTELWAWGVSVLILATSAWLARRGRRLLSLYLGLVGVNFLWSNLAARGGALERLTWEGPEPVVFWIVVLALAVGGRWALRGRLTAERAQNLALILLVTLLFEHTDFIEDPFSPLLGFSGIAIIAVGVVWDALSFGAWANSASPTFPRTSRIFLYLGYVLFGVAVVNWAVATHDLENVTNYTGGLALAGFNLLGKPLLYAVFVALLLGPNDPPEPRPEPPTPAPKSPLDTAPGRE